MITHKSFVSSVAATKYVMEINENDSLLSYLPMAHVFEKILQANSIINGAHMGFYRGDPKLLVEDVCELKPTIFAGVPRVYQKVKKEERKRESLIFFLRCTTESTIKLRRALGPNANCLRVRTQARGTREEQES